MPECKNCGKKWDWKTAFNKTLNYTKGTRCPKCNELQYVTPETRKKSALFCLIPIAGILIPNAFFQLDLVTMLLLGLVLFLFTMAILPLTIELSNEDEPLW